MPVYPHMIVDCKDLNIEPSFKSNRQYVKLFIDTLIKEVNMKKWGRAQVQYLHEPEHLRGLSYSQMITTSNVMLHIFEDDDSLCLDLFSCKGFDPQVVTAVVRRFFNPTQVSTQVINRGFNSGFGDFI